MSFIHEDGSETSWSNSMVSDLEFGWVIDEGLHVDFDDDFIRHLDPEDQYRVRCIQIAQENEAAMKIDSNNYAAADSFMAIFGFHRVNKRDIISEETKEGSMDPMNANMLPEITDADVEKAFTDLLETNDAALVLADPQQKDAGGAVLGDR